MLNLNGRFFIEVGSVVGKAHEELMASESRTKVSRVCTCRECIYLRGALGKTIMSHVHECLLGKAWEDFVRLTWMLSNCHVRGGA